MTTSEERPTPAGYRRAEDACLARAAEAVRFDLATPDDDAALAERHVAPLRSVLVGLVRGLGPRRTH